MGTEWSADELDRWFEEDFLDGAPPSGATFDERFGGDATDWAEHDEGLQAFMTAWDDMTNDRTWDHTARLINREPEDAWRGCRGRPGRAGQCTAGAASRGRRARDPDAGR